MQKTIKKAVALAVACVMILFCAGCNNSPSENSTAVSNLTDAKETTAEENETFVNNSHLGRESNVLIACFSWSGNTDKLSEMIKNETGADIFRITPETPYGDDFDECAERAQSELNDGVRPALSSHIDKDAMEKYDIILLGYPIWWYDLPMPVWTFLEEYDLSDKTIIPFFTHNGSSGGAGSLETVKKLCPNSTVKTEDALSVPGKEVEGAVQQVKEWISKLGINA